MRKTMLATVCAIVLGVGSSAFAQGFLCDLVGGADLSPGLDASVQGGQLEFAFQGTLSNCQGDYGSATMVCAQGTLDATSCAGNATTGESYVVCAGGCTSSPGVAAACDSGTPLLSGTFNGACVGSLCAGGSPTPGALYEVMFDEATVEAALAACNAVDPEGSVTRAGFTGVIAYEAP